MGLKKARKKVSAAATGSSHTAIKTRNIFEEGRTLRSKLIVECWLLLKLTVQLLWSLRVSFKWIIMTLRLFMFVFFLLPAFLRICWFWLFDIHVSKNIAYGVQGRNSLDIYMVQYPNRKRLPVVVFLSGGAWIIGYKAWGALMGRVLSSYGILVVTPDYRNFPQGILPDIIADADNAMQWVFENIHHYGGDPNNITLIGQSAGAHIGFCLLLENVKYCTRDDNHHSTAITADNNSKTNSNLSNTLHTVNHSITETAVTTSSTKSDSLKLPPSNSNKKSPYKYDMNRRHSVRNQLKFKGLKWNASDLRNFIGISGPYNINESIEEFHNHGLDRRVLSKIMNHQIEYYSPTSRMLELAELVESCTDRFPPVHLFHGTADKTVNFKSTAGFAEALKHANVEVYVKYYENKSHTDPIIEDPINCENDPLLNDVIDIIQVSSPIYSPTKSFKHPIPPQELCPKFLIQCARIVNPF